MLSGNDLLHEAAASSFQAEPLEKVLRLLELLDALRSHPFLRGRIVLKGGTALNLFVLDIPRLSVDIDLNYVGAVDRETMLAEKPQVDAAIGAVCGRLDIRIRRTPGDHAGGKYRLTYTNAFGRASGLELDVNYLLRTPLWPPETLDSRTIGSFSATQIPVLDIHELAAGKLAALFSRHAARDLFDVRGLLQHARLDADRLRLAFVVYGGANRRDWRKVAIEDINTERRELERQLFPMLRAHLVPQRHEVESWIEALIRDCTEQVSVVLPLRANEIEFLTNLNEDGTIAAELLSSDTDVQKLIRFHPGLLWKAQNVREYRTGREH